MGRGFSNVEPVFFYVFCNDILVQKKATGRGWDEIACMRWYFFNGNPGYNIRKIPPHTSVDGASVAWASATAQKTCHVSFRLTAPRKGLTLLMRFCWRCSASGGWLRIMLPCEREYRHYGDKAVRAICYDRGEVRSVSLGEANSFDRGPCHLRTHYILGVMM